MNHHPIEQNEVHQLEVERMGLGNNVVVEEADEDEADVDDDLSELSFDPEDLEELPPNLPKKSAGDELNLNGISRSLPFARKFQIALDSP